MDGSTKEVSLATQLCNGCGEEKPLTKEFFYRRSDPNHGNGWLTPCKKCRNGNVRVNAEHTAAGRERARIILLLTGTQQCAECKQYKFANYDFFARADVNHTGLHSTCKECCKRAVEQRKLDDPLWWEEQQRYHADYNSIWYLENKESRTAQINIYNQNNPTVVLNKQVRFRHNITSVTLGRMTEEQGGVCGNPYCSSDNGLRRLCVDHDHSCCPGKRSCGRCIRGLLCHPCNTTLGFLSDDVQRIWGIIDYLNSDPTIFTQARDWLTLNPVPILSVHRKWHGYQRHHLDLVTQGVMVNIQDNTCGIKSCGRTNGSKRLDIDHDHRCCLGRSSCGRCIRGLLCGPCNKAIGLLNDDIRRFTGLAKYLVLGGFPYKQPIELARHP